MTSADLPDSRFESTTLSARRTNTLRRRANFSGATLDKATLNFAGCNLRNVNFGAVNLAGADFEGANLTGANLKGAKLVGANFKRATLGGADLTSADLTGSRFESTTLSAAKDPTSNRQRGQFLWRHLGQGNPQLRGLQPPERQLCRGQSRWC